MKREPRSLLTRPLALLLAAALAAGPLPLPVLAAETQPTAAVQPATPETAAAAEETEPPASQAAETETAEPPAAPAPETTATPENAQPALMTLAEAAPLSGETEPAAGDTITIDGIEYEVDRVAAADRNGALTLTNGAAASGALVLADGIEYAGGLYDITALEDDAFKGNNALTSIDMSASNVTSIGDDCFNGCTMLTTVDLSGDKFKTVRKNAFKDCTALTWVDLSGETSKSMGEACFSGCSSLKEIVFPQVSYTNFTNKNVFFGCTSLTELYIPTPNIGGSAGKNPFNGCNLKSLIVDTLHGEISSGLFSSVQDGFTLTVTNELYSSDIIDANAFGSEKTVTLYLPTAEDVEKYTAVFADKENVTVKLYGGEEEALATVIDPNGVRTPCATLMDAIAAVNAAETEGTYTIQTRSTGATPIEWTGNVAPNKATVIDFAGASVDLPATLTLQAPLTIQNITNINSDTDTLTTLVAGEHAFAMIDGGSFGFAEIRGSDLTFEGTLPGGKFGGGAQVQLVGAGDTPTVTCKNVGRTDHYYNLPNMTGFAELVLDGAYLEADATEAYSNQLDGAKAVTLKDGGLKLNASAEIESLSGKGELRMAEGAARTVTGSASGSFTLPEVTGTELSSEVLSLPAGSEITLTNQAGEPVTITEPVVEDPAVTVTGGSLSDTGYATLADAFAAITADAGDRYTLTLQKDAALEATGKDGVRPLTELPAKALVIDGKGHTLTQNVDNKDNVVAAGADLTLRNVDLDADRMILEVRADGAVLTVENTVSGAIAKLDDESKNGASIAVYAREDGVNVVGHISGSGKNKGGEIRLIGFGSQAEPTEACPSVGSSSDGDKAGKLILENSWVVSGYGSKIANQASAWGNAVIRTAGGVLIPANQQAASPSSWTVEDGAVADLYVTKASNGFNCLSINALGSASGKTQIHIVGDEAPAAGDTLVKVPANKSENATFVIADDSVDTLGGLVLVREENGNYVLQAPAEPVVTVTGGSLNAEGYATLSEAFAAITADAGDRYALTLLCEQTFDADTTLPDAALTIDGNGCKLAMDAGSTLTAQNSLTLKNVELAMQGATLTYTGSGSKKELVFEDSVTGALSHINDSSGARYLSIVLEADSFAFETITGTTTDDNLQNATTTLYLTGFGSEEAPVDLKNKVLNLSAIELDDCWLTASGDASYLGVVRAASANAQGALTLTGDTTLAGFGLKENGEFEVRMPADATLTVTGNYSRQYPVVLTLTGTAEDGHLLIDAPKIRKDGAFAVTGPDEAVKLCWDGDTRQFTLSYAPAIAMAEEAEMYKDAYTRPVLTLTDAQGIASISINGSERFTYEEGSPWLTVTPEADWLAQGENTVTATDVSGLTASFTFRYDAPADYGKVDEALGKIPADLSGYTAASVQALEAARDAVVEGVGSSDQALVDKMAQDILDAIAALEPVPSTDPDQPADPDRPADDQPADGDGDGNGANNSDNTSHTANSSQSSQAASASGSAAQPVQAAAAVIPQTADAAMPALWALLAAAALGGATVLTLLRRKHGQ